MDNMTEQLGFVTEKYVEQWRSPEKLFHWFTAKSNEWCLYLYCCYRLHCNNCWVCHVFQCYDWLPFYVCVYIKPVLCSIKLTGLELGIALKLCFLNCSRDPPGGFWANFRWIVQLPVWAHVPINLWCRLFDGQTACHQGRRSPWLSRGEDSSTC